jgi:hypothetical protein
VLSIVILMMTNAKIKPFKVLIVAIVALFLGVHIGVEMYIHRDIVKPIENSQPKVWYFAYGTNMSTRYLTNVRHVGVYLSLPAYVLNYSVTLSKPGLPGIEPSFALLTNELQSTAYGVLHQITVQDLERVIHSEGTGYNSADVEVHANNGNTYRAKTLVGTSQLKPHYQASKRYINILLEGATEHGLPLPYIQTLRETDMIYIPVLSEIVGTLIYLTVIVTSQ